MPFRKSTLWPYAILLVECAAFFRRVLFQPHKYVIPWDLRYYHLQMIQFVAKSFSRGELPLWDPFTYCGWPIYAQLATQAFYPPTVLAALASNLFGGRHMLYFLELQVIAHVFLAGVFAYLLLRRLGTGIPAALVGASVFELGPFFASQTQHLGAMDTAPWLPLSWLAVVALAEKFEWRWVAALAASLGMSILAGFPALTIVGVVSCFLLAGALLSWRSIAGVAVACTWAAGLAGIQILPTLEFIPRSIAKYRGDWLAGAGGYPLESLYSLAIPNYWGIFQFGRRPWTLPWNPTFLYVYCGMVGLACVLAAVFGRRSRYAPPFLILSAAGLVWMLGENTPVGRTIFQLLPAAVKLPMYAEYSLAMFSSGMAVLAGLGAQKLLQGRSPALQASLAAACALELIAVGSTRPMNTAATSIEPGVAYEQVEGDREAPGKMRELVNLTVPPARADTMNASINWPGNAPLLEIPTASGNDPFAPERIIQVRMLFCRGERWQRFCQISSPDSKLIDLLNIRYIISRAPLGATRFHEVAELPGDFVYENPDWLPRFFLVSRVREARGMSEALAEMRKADFDPRVEAVVEGAASVAEPRASASGTVRVTSYRPSSLTLEVESSAPAYLVTSETFYPGWRAFLDGRPQPLYTTNAAFRGMPVPAGRHTVDMRFEPRILSQGAAVSGISWAALAALLLGDWTSRRKLNRPSTSSAWSANTSA